MERALSPAELATASFCPLLRKEFAVISQFARNAEWNANKKITGNLSASQDVLSAGKLRNV